MTWVRQRKPGHHCKLPQYVAHPQVSNNLSSAGLPGDLYRCEECNMLWRSTATTWEKARWWQFLVYALAGYTKGVK